MTEFLLAMTIFSMRKHQKTRSDLISEKREDTVFLVGMLLLVGFDLTERAYYRLKRYASDPLVLLCVILLLASMIVHFEK